MKLAESKVSAPEVHINPKQKRKLQHNVVQYILLYIQQREMTVKEIQERLC